MIRERELRLALVCYGGVSLAVYMHGVTKELWKLLRASEARKSEEQLPGDTEPIWLELISSFRQQTDFSIVCDILAGASAGGLNAVLLSEAIARGHDIEPLTDMWLEEADVEHLLDPEARPADGMVRRLGRLYKEPVAWLAAHQMDSLTSVDDPDVRREVVTKLAGFVRSRWFKPPFSGDGLTAMLDLAMDAMQDGPTGRSLIPPTIPLNLFVTVTDYWGANTVLPIHSPPAVTEREHRRVFAFESPPVALHDPAPRSPAAERPALLFAARATASFPGAFPPATISEIDRRMEKTGMGWADRDGFVNSQLPDDRPPENVLLIDGSVLDNAPFGPAIDAVRSRVAHREVDRRFVYIDPKPGVSGPLDGLERQEPGFLTVMLRSLADIPRAQPIRDSLENINQLSARVRRIAEIVTSMTPDVDTAISRAVGAHFFLWPLAGERMRRARARIHSTAAESAGFAYSGYAQLKLHGVIDEAAHLLRHGAGLDADSGAMIRYLLAEVVTERDGFDHEAALAFRPSQTGFVKFLRNHDIGFRVRRLRFFVRRLIEVVEQSLSEEEREAGERLKSAMYRALSPFETLRLVKQQADAASTVTILQSLAESDPNRRRRLAADALDHLAAENRLSELDAEVDAQLAAGIADSAFARDTRQKLVRAWLGFPFYDIVILPMMQVDVGDSFDEIKVDRISPDDATALRKGGARACLKGWQLNAFAGFFSRAYRENDYLFGRLHAAERFVDIVASAVPETGIATHRWKARLFEAILREERARLTRVGPLIDDLEKELQLWSAM